MALSSISSDDLHALHFNVHPWWARVYRGLIFLPRALRQIRLRQLHPNCSIHFVSSEGGAIGISDGDIRYPASEGELSRLQPLIVALEDKRFFTHHGIDLRAVVRAIFANIRARRIVQGGSTITQQLVRNTLLAPERSIPRKLFELVLALALERHYTKQEILNLYCNQVYLGRGIRGFPAAARVIFRKRLQDLSEAQLHGLIGLLRKPASTFPTGQCEQFLSRQMKIAVLLRHKPLHPLSKPNPIDISNHRNPRFTRIVRAELSRSGQTLTGIRRVGLTIDRNVQHALRESLREAAVTADVTHAAGIAVSLKTGDVLGESAFESGREAESSPSYFGILQPGSTFKTFALLSALQQGISLDDNLLSAPFESLCFVRDGSTPWRVRNYANAYRGELSLLEAFRHSDNTAFARLVEMLDTDALYRTYQAFGLGQLNVASASIVLGGHKHGVNLLSLVAAYRSIGVGGNYVRPRILQYAELADGSLAWFPRARVQPLVCDFRSLRDLQRALLEAGPRIGASQYAGKTGTTRSGSLFAGYSDEVAAAIWIGYGKPVKEGDPKATGALGVFHRLMHRLVGRSDLLSI